MYAYEKVGCVKKKVTVLIVVLVIRVCVIVMSVMLSSATMAGISCRAPSTSLSHVIVGAGTPSASQVRLELAGDVTVSFIGAAVMVAGTTGSFIVD